jgi:serine/threonine protein kinase
VQRKPAATLFPAQLEFGYLRPYAVAVAATRDLPCSVRIPFRSSGLHRPGIVHRDVKPANALHDVDGAAILTDHGLANGRGAASVEVAV